MDWHAVEEALSEEAFKKQRDQGCQATAIAVPNPLIFSGKRYAHYDTVKFPDHCHVLVVCILS